MSIAIIKAPDIRKEKDIYSHSSAKIKYSTVKYVSKIFLVSMKSIRWKLENQNTAYTVLKKWYNIMDR